MVEALVSNKSSFKFLISLFLLAVMVVSLQFHNGAVRAQELTPSADSNSADFDTFSVSYYRLMKEYMEPLKPEELIHGAVKGMNVALAHDKIAYTVHVPTLTDDADNDLQAFNNTFNKTVSAVNGKIASDDLMTQALDGMFDVTGDPYTVYMTPKEFQMLSEQMNGGDFGGVGIYIELDKSTKQLMVLEPIEDTPAWTAGLKSGDFILKIDGKSTKGISLDEAQREIRGPVGSKVTLTIKRKGDAAVKDVAVTRNLIHVKSVSSKMIDGNIGYVRLRLFGEFTGDEVEKAMEQLEHQGAKAYIVDLRNNGGGYIDAAKEVCSKFLPRGDVVVSLQDREGHTQTEVADGSEHADYPVVVLVNEFSASASEITAGALQDYKRATILGVKTFGKGSVQTISRLPNGGAVKITIAHYHTPNGRDINKKGIQPDVMVPMQGHDYMSSSDSQLQKALNLLKHDLTATTSSR